MGRGWDAGENGGSWHGDVGVEDETVNSAIPWIGRDDVDVDMPMWHTATEIRRL